MTLARGELKETDPRGPAESVAEAPLYLTFRGLVVSLQRERFGYVWLKEKEVTGSCRCPGSLGVRPGLSTFLPL